MLRGLAGGSAPFTPELDAVASAPQDLDVALRALAGRQGDRRIPRAATKDAFLAAADKAVCLARNRLSKSSATSK
jgi:hypothetical protein